MRQPKTTGRVAIDLGVIEPRLNDLVRRGKINPPPPVVDSRRHWDRSHILQAARHLGLLTKELKASLDEELLPEAQR